MARLFIHGVPDTPAMWGRLFAALDASDPADAIARHAPALPGFGVPLPDDFPPTMHAYADWLTAKVEALHAASGPVDLVGHDWGAILTLRVASQRPTLIRSWAAINGAFDPGYRGHAIARMWATPTLGEALMGIMGPRTGRLVLPLLGLPAEVAAHEARQVSPTMKRAILGLYRSADGLRDFGPWHAELETLPARGLLVWGDRDPFLPVPLAERVAARAGVPLHVEPGAGHWTPVVRADSVAAALRRLWRDTGG